MDKKIIHIDDLSRQLLGQREEEPRPGAWMTMRELLDKEMPVGVLPAAGFAWRRYLSMALVLLLISLATIGGYRISGPYSNANGALKGLADVAARLPAAVPAHGEKMMGAPEAALSNKAAILLPENNTANHANEHGSANPAVKAIATAAAVSRSKASGNNKTLVTDAGNKQAMAAQTKTKNNEVAAPVFIASNEEAASFAALSSKKVIKNLEVIPGAPALSKSVTIGKPGVTQLDKAVADNHNPAVAAGVSHAPAVSGEKSKNNNDSKPFRTDATSSSAVKQKKHQAPRKHMMLVRDTIQQIQLAQRMVPRKSMRGFELKFDTISISDFVQEKWVQAEPVSAYVGIGPMPQTEAAANKSVLQAAPAYQTEDGAGSYVSLAGQQVSTRKIKTQGITLRDRLQMAMFQMSQIKAYTGLVAGFGVSPFGNMPTYGFHLGLSQAFQLSPEWTVVAEFKYNRIMGKDLMLRDDYVACYNMSSSQQGGNTVYNWQQDSVAHYFKVPALQTLVIPVSLQYNLNRIFFMGGFNFSYSPRINSEEITRWRNQPVAQTYTGSGAYTQLPPGYEEGLPSVKIDDFGSRFSVGYQLGVGYELSPALKLDVRCSQQFWDNAATQGAKKVSKEFFRMPNVQLSVGYRFGKTR